ncbi:Bcr/CflA subfamily drug resistance transporter [Hyphomicrobium denitrificans 1NES1]|uniref:Bcr/CflA subfamily drug resistance transporter n=1 Tax=Hyphomicrobium denitrificans 1NES1 TaxID=670307 RepID=N0BGI0_9HYPH|nr:multidrug effflux MFS transporter [Hyphomicrobium denitrificans]AGK59511.1 Bcr/CflA subfamily drug resistance transporter [Hyphomicrobium denitrificans 1NES1]
MNALEREDDVLSSTGSPQALHNLSFVEFVVLTAAMMALTAISIDIMLPALPQIGAALGVTSANDRQLVVILYMAGFAAGQFFFGPLSDHVGRKPALMAGLAIYIVGTVAALISNAFPMLLAARLVQGIGAASPRVIAIAVVRDLYGGRQMARVMSFAMMVFIVIPVLAPSIGQALIQLGDWHWAFYALLAMAILIAIWAGFRLPETAAPALGLEHAMSLRDSLKTAIFDSQTMAYGAAGGFMFGCLLAYVASAQQVFVEVFGMGEAFPVVFGAIASVMAVASFVNARLVGRLGMRRLSHAALLGFVAVSLCLAFATAAGSAGILVYAPLVASAFFLFGLIAPNFNAIAMEPQGHNAGMASSVTGSLSTAIGAMAGGLVAHAFNGTVFPIAAGFAACSLTACLIVFAVEGKHSFFGRNRRA